MVHQAFDPAAATAAYLAQVPPEVHARATAFTHGTHWLLFWGLVVSILAAVVVIRLKLLRRLQQRLERNRPRPNLVAFALAAVFVASLGVLLLPWTIYAEWWRPTRYGLTSQPFAGWLAEAGLTVVLEVLFTSIFAVGLYALIRRSPRRWWLWAGAFAAVFLLFVMFIVPVFVEPLFNTYTPAPAGEVRDAVTDLADSVGIPSERIYIYDGSRQSNRYTANVAGIGGTARIAMSDVMFERGADLAEVRGVVGHEIGHFVKRHVLWSILAFALLLTASFWIIAAAFPAVASRLGAHDVRGIADPAGIPVIFVLVSVLLVLATPVTNALSRTMELQADRYSLELANEPDGLAGALVKTVEYRAATPGRLEEMLFYSHPSVSSRVRRAMEWKAMQER